MKTSVSKKRLRASGSGGGNGASRQPWKATRLSNVCIELELAASGENWHQWILVTSDRHWDHPDSDLKLQKKHLDQALERNAAIIDLGDMFCVMQSRFDKRATRGKVREEHNAPNYGDLVVTTAADWFAPYAKNFVLVGMGNHETAFMRMAETNLTQRFATHMNVAGGSVFACGYRGWLRIQATRSTRHASKMIWWHHGSGGNAPVTKGILGAARRSAVYPDADILISGHTHEKWQWPITRQRITKEGVEKTDTQLNLQIPSYKNSLLNKDGGWEVEKGFAPQTTGAYWLKVTYSGAELNIKVEEAE